LAAALFGNRARGRELTASLIAGVDPTLWFSAYVEQLLPPLLFCFFEQGLVFEPHLQNILIGLRDGFPVQVFLRDFDNGKVVRDWFDAKHFEGVPTRVRDELTYETQQAWSSFNYCLMVNHLAEAIYSIAGSDEALELRLWGVIRESLLSYQTRFGTERSREKIAHLISAASLPAKANLLTRFLKKPDRKAGYLPVPNPMQLPEVRSAIETRLL
jgi:siderophore synthetase component